MTELEIMQGWLRNSLVVMNLIAISLLVWQGSK